MFKNSILRYLNSAAVFDTDEAIAAQRAAIAANTVTAKADDNENEDNKEVKDENNDDDGKTNKDDDNNDNDDNEDEQDESEEDDDKEDDDKGEDETDEQKQARLAKEKEERKQARIQKRIDKLVATAELTKKENEALKKQLAEKAVEGLSEEEVQRRAEAIAADLVKKREEEEGGKLFAKDCDTIQNAAIKSDKDFMRNINAAAEEVGPIPQLMIGILVHELDNDNGGDVLAYLAKNVDEYEDIYNLSSTRMTAKLIRLSDKIKAEKDAAKAAGKKAKSKVPPPIEPVIEGRDARTANAIPSNPTKNIDEYVRIRNQQEAEKRKARGY